MKYAVLITAATISFQLTAQTASREFLKDTSKYNFIVIDSKYQNQFAFWGRDYNQKLPILATSLMYFSHSGIWASVSNFKFFNEAVPTQFGLTFGYFKELSPKVDWHLSYSQFYVSSDVLPSAYKTQAYFQTSLGFEWGLLFSNFQAHVLINQHSDFFLTSSHSRYFEFNELLWKTIKVSFEPKFSFTIGTHNFEYANGLVIAPGGGGVVSQATNGDAGTRLEFLNFDFVFPLKFAVGYFALEPSWKYTLPLNANPDYGTHGLSLWSLGLNYYIPFKK